MFNTLPANPYPPSSEQMGAGGGSSYVLPTASADTLGGVKVGSNLSIADGVLSAPAPYGGDVYSATGVKIGTWLGVDLYRKVVSLGALPNDDTKLVSLDMASDEKPLFFTAFATNATGNVQPLPFVDDSAKSSDVLCDIVPVVDGDGFNMRIITAHDKSSYNGYCILYYTKITSNE